ncbi:hypothetical protein PRIPAC_79005 [Pristionchus pacificus]|uniref:Uncharacterized protein n=1 Tax=Pristionchus pacificus TaxID=54126 RepID=A0A2A6BXU8_PRIPA|nr:hypothetical protein PRIPAC_79005 [Pristionchus pacificus]|eukprot:PDM70754.1 hypothetical protein PRIPAC_44958 [Pristionchus pacificus]
MPPKGKMPTKTPDGPTSKRKRPSAEYSKAGEDTPSSSKVASDLSIQEGDKKEEVIGPNDLFSRLPPDCIYAVCDYLEREMIDVLCAVNHCVYNTIYSPHHYKLGIRKEGCTLHLYKNAGGFGFDFEVKMWKTVSNTKKGVSGSRKTKKKVEQSEVYSYYIDRKGKERRYIDENLECARTSEWTLVGIKEAERKSPGTFPNQLYDALRAITIRFSLKNLWLNCVILDSTLLNTIIDLNASKISYFVFSFCTLHKDVTREECGNGVQWLDSMTSVQGRRCLEAVTAFKNLLQEATNKR